MRIRNQKFATRARTAETRNVRGSTIVELIIVIILFIILVPSSLNLYLSAKKLTGQAYIQHRAATIFSETNDILTFLRNQGFETLTNGTFYLIRNPGTGSWLIKSDMPDTDTYEIRITVSDAFRHQASNHIYFPGDVGTYYVDDDTKKIDITILWDTDYLSTDLKTQTLYITNWQRVFTYSS